VELEEYYVNVDVKWQGFIARYGKTSDLTSGKTST
jgi:hypothetical protein